VLCRFLANGESHFFPVHVSPSESLPADTAHVSAASISQRLPSQNAALPWHAASAKDQATAEADTCSSPRSAGPQQAGTSGGHGQGPRPSSACAATSTFSGSPAHHMTRSCVCEVKHASSSQQGASGQHAVSPVHSVKGSMHAARAIHSTMGAVHAALPDHTQTGNAGHSLLQRRLATIPASSIVDAKHAMQAGDSGWRGEGSQHAAAVQTESLAALERAAKLAPTWAQTTLHGKPGYQQHTGFLSSAVMLETLNRQKQAVLLQPEDRRPPHSWAGLEVQTRVQQERSAPPPKFAQDRPGSPPSNRCTICKCMSPLLCVMTKGQF